MQKTSTEKNLALIGAGYWGKNLARNFNKLGALATICDTSQETLKGYGQDFGGVVKETDVGKVMSDPLITRVAIAAPAVLHFSLAREALLAGKDVYVEKPLCLEISQAKELIRVANEKNAILMVGHLLQYHPCIIKLKELIGAGELGKLHYITSNRLNLGKIRQEENALWSFAPHDISVILALVGHQLPELVSCTGESYITKGVADTTLTSLSFGGSVRAHIFVSWLNPFKEQKLTVVGSKGMAVFDDTRPWGEKLLVHQDYLTWTDGSKPTPTNSKGAYIKVDESEPLQDECRHFLACCHERVRARTDGVEGMRVLQVLEAAQKSLGSNGLVISLSGEPCADKKRIKLQEYFVHPSAVVDEGAEVGKSSKIWHFSHVMKGARTGENCILGQNVNVDGGAVIGNNVKIQNNVSIYNGLSIEDDVFLGPSCVLTNVTNPRSQVNRHSLYEKTLIKKGATLGANSTVVCGVTIGRYAFVAAGAVVTRDVPDYGLVVGNPARRTGWMSRHGHILREVGEGGIMTCPESGFRYTRDDTGRIFCMDVNEDAGLPPHLRQGSKSYRQFK